MPTTSDVENLHQQKQDENGLVISYLTQRNLIGFLGILLPIMLWLLTYRSPLDRKLEPAISDYYYTSTGEIFTSILCALSIFLFTYTGYDFKDKLFTRVAAVACFLVVMNPTRFKHTEYIMSKTMDSMCIRQNMLSIDTVACHSVHVPRLHVPHVYSDIEYHLLFALIFLFCLACMSICSFTEGNSKEKDAEKTKKELTQKRNRNIVYRICGWVIIACLIVLAAYMFYCDKHGIDTSKKSVIFIFETIAVWAFGFSWLTKGQTLWPDGEHYIHKAYRQAFHIKEVR